MRECEKEYNRYYSPEAKVEIVEIKNNDFIKISGICCFTCGAHDYFEDFIYLLKERGIEAKIRKVEEGKGKNLVKIELAKIRRV